MNLFMRQLMPFRFNRLSLTTAILLLVLSLSLVSPVSAATYYVDQTAGNDNNVGSQASPWQDAPGMTAYTGSGSLVAGDTVYFDKADTWLVSGGQGLFLVGGVTYIGNVFGVSGTRAIIRASSSVDAGVVRFRDHATIPTVFEGFEVDANHTVSSGIDINHRFSSSMIGAVKRVVNNLVHGVSSDQNQGQFKYGIIASSFNGDRTANVEIIDNTVWDISRDAICLYPGDNSATNLLSTVLVRGNTSFDTGQDTNYCCGAGLLIKGHVTDATVEYNYSHDTKGAAVFINSNETNHFGVGIVNLHLRYNILTTAASNVNGIIRVYDGSGGTDGKDLHIYGNLVFNNTTTGGLHIGTDAVGTETIRVYNNTFYNAPVTIATSAATFSTMEVRNNIFHFTAGVTLTDSEGNITAHSNNIYYRPSGTAVTSNGANYTAAGIIAGYEATGLGTDPLFVNVASVPTGFNGAYGSTLAPNTSGFTLQTGSPAFNSGVTLASPYTNSINSVVRPSSTAFERGAYELTAGPGPPTNVGVNAKPAQPAIKSLNPTSGIVGSTVTVTGSGFATTQGSGSVTINGVTATPTAWSALSLAVTVPSTTTGNVVVNQSGLSSNGVTFTVTSGANYFTGVTRTSADCTLAAVSATIAASADRDIVQMPACSQTNWTSQLTVTKAIALIGAGQGVTTLGDNVPKTGADTSHLMAFNIPSGKSFVIAGFTIVGVANDSNDWNKGHILLSGSSTAWRMHHVTFNSLQTSAVKVDGCLYGLFDHLTINGDVTHFGGIEVKHGTCNGSNWGDYSWATALDAGGPNNVYIEDSTISGNDANFQLNAADCLEGGRVVWRFNALSRANFTSHGTDSGQRERGCRWQEYYNNVMVFPSTMAVDFMTWIRGGSGVVYNNTVTATNTVNQMTKGNNCRDAGGGCSGGPNYAIWGACDGTRPYDQNTAGQSGYRCLDQPGAGTGVDWLGASTPPSSWGGNALEPFYVWNNTRNGGAYNVVAATTHVQSGRDYFNNGTARPGYTAYTYPHPLQTSLP